ncbi:glycosyltransferase family 2 protein [Chromohalobacter beijerinckii]|uniref:Glycosyltransferase family 2 protein n=2 Tax=Chromohalobacter TaxID=42054 RepID=A0ABZ0YAT4_9GAMM|nr:MULTISPECIES: glycosyltransferase family 2 protein [Chromohalobacter]NWO11562.1 glycosyltransferase family 2 protein [Chromohalobacter salexigens]MCK0767097.1 glycosyltransferase family 2 protein [Chromohalobacter beijerinckii]MCK0769464.1 glycosyltransferase family 2 protein [Chromohalobacter canadensis]MCT8468135.1 glycosyltransferase family 2 protein [Chromohalobacter canadensis]MCT8470155.1 glycosyltransferase family 2 protein [Chromohalobacter canadensis]
MRPKTLSVIIPAKDEVENLPTLLDEIDQALVSIEHEIIVIDDGSIDDTQNWLANEARKNPRLRAYRHHKSSGQSTSIWQAARLAEGDWLATIDADGQNDPADIPILYQYASTNTVTVIAGHRNKRRDIWHKRFSSKIANRIRSKLLNDSTPDTGCGLKLINKNAFLKLPYFNHMHRFIPALIQAQGGTCISMNVNHRERQNGHSHYGLHDRLWVGIIDILGVMWLRRRSRLPANLMPLVDSYPTDNDSGKYV